MRLPDVEGVLLWGGSSRRMGLDKGSILVHGVPCAHKIAIELLAVCASVTVLGGEEIEGCRFVADQEPGAGPLRALAGFEPRCPWVMVVSVDIPRFDRRVVEAFRGAIGEREAMVPLSFDRPQPLCALYDATAFLDIVGDRVITWLMQLDIEMLGEMRLKEIGVDPMWIMSANTPEEWRRLVR